MTDDALEYIDYLDASRVFPDESPIECMSPCVAVVCGEIALADGVGVFFFLFGCEKFLPTPGSELCHIFLILNG